MSLSDSNLKQLRQYWQSQYESSQELLDNLEAPTVFVGFNIDLDFIYQLEGEKLRELTSAKGIRREVKLRRNHSFQVIENFNEFLTALLNAIDESEPKEIDLANKSIREEIKKEFVPQNKSIGGQAGIIANFLAQLGLDTIVYTPLLSSRQVDYLEESLLYPRVVDGELALDKVTNCVNGTETKNNLVFEYSKRFEIPHLGIKADKDGRFILSDFLTDFSVLLPSPIIHRSEKLFNRVDRVIVSGYHDLADKNFYSRLRRAGQQLERIRNANRHLKIHLELASQKNEELEGEILSNIAVKVDSLGFDEAELPQVLRTINDEALASQIEAESGDLLQVWRALKTVASRLDLDRCQLHCDKYLVCLVSDDYEVNRSKLKESLLLGGNVAVSKASLGEIPDEKAIRSSFRSKVSARGLKEMKKFQEELDLPQSFLKEGINQVEGDDFTLVVVPAALAEKVESLVGLGDVISAASFVGESF